MLPPLLRETTVSPLMRRPVAANPPLGPKSDERARPLRGLAPHGIDLHRPRSEKESTDRCKGFLRFEAVHIGTGPPLAAADRPQPANDTSVRARALVARKLPLRATSTSRPKSGGFCRPPWEVANAYGRQTHPPSVLMRTYRSRPPADLLQDTGSECLHPIPAAWVQQTRGCPPCLHGRRRNPQRSTPSRVLLRCAPRASSGRSQLPSALRQRNVRACNCTPSPVPLGK